MKNRLMELKNDRARANGSQTTVITLLFTRIINLLVNLVYESKASSLAQYHTK